MALIETTIDPSEQTTRHIRNAATGCFQQMLATWNNGYQLLWHNPYGLTPQQVCDAMGTDAYSMFVSSYQLGELLNAFGAGIVNAVPEGVTYTVSEDGRVTITSGG